MSHPAAIGIDIGATKIAVGIVDASGAVIAAERLPTAPERGFDDGVARIVRAIGELAARSGWRMNELRGIGIGCTGPVNVRTGVIETDYTLPGWGGRNLVQALADAAGLPVLLENDADAALLGEAGAGAGRGCASIVMLTLGTGVGGAAMSGKRIYRGASGEHPEIGHVPVAAEHDGPPCYCGLRGCLEAVASGTGIAQAGRAHGFADAGEVFAAARSGDARAAAIVAAAVEACRTALWTIIHTFLPEMVILGGGIIEAHYDLFEAPLQQIIAAATLKPSKGMRLARAQLGNNAGMVGAALLAINGRNDVVAAD